MIGECTSYLLIDKHIVDGVLIFNHREKYKAWVREMQVDIDNAHKGCVHFDGERHYFDVDEEDLLDDEEKVCMVHTKSSLSYK